MKCYVGRGDAGKLRGRGVGKNPGCKCNNLFFLEEEEEEGREVHSSGWEGPRGSVDMMW